MTQVQTTALTVVERAVLALGKKDYGPTLIALAEASKSITVITNADGYQQCHASRMALKNERVQIEKDGKAARDDATKFNKAVIAEEARLIALISPEEIRLERLQKAWDDAREAEKEARIAAELARVEDLQERLAELRGNRTLSAMSGSGLIAEHIADLEALPADESFQELQQAAEDAKASGLSWLRQVHAAALAHEAEQARIKAEREELAKLRAEQVRRDAEDRARRESEEAAARKVRQEAERAAAEARAKHKAEDDRIAAERKAVLDAEQKRIDAARAEQEAVAKTERDRLAAERAEFERQQAAQRKVPEPAPVTRRGSAVQKPSAADMIAVLAKHYRAHPDTITDWLRTTDFSKSQDAA